MMTALAFTWDFPYLQQKQKEHRWLRTSDNSRNGHNVQGFVGQRIGILGYGSIGRQIARLAKALGMEVFAYTASARHTPESRMDTGYVVTGTGDVTGEIPVQWFSGMDRASLHHFLAQDLDMLVLCTPST
jgi:phosphoglycerate dehydrogenase-like enzyme